jgi:hypothetical protein
MTSKEKPFFFEIGVELPDWVLSINGNGESLRNVLLG